MSLGFTAFAALSACQASYPGVPRRGGTPAGIPPSTCGHASATKAEVRERWSLSCAQAASEKTRRIVDVNRNSIRLPSLRIGMFLLEPCEPQLSPRGALVDRSLSAATLGESSLNAAAILGVPLSRCRDPCDLLLRCRVQPVSRQLVDQLLQTLLQASTPKPRVLVKLS
jgi:hypothetical protein